MDTQLANDRTYLAWLRTGIALFGLGFVVAKFALLATDDAALSNKDLYSAAGVVIVVTGAALVVVGYLQHQRVAQTLSIDDAMSQARWPRTITFVAVAGALLLSLLIVVST
jgi:uncharacterized membrane protein YidH (DUF202 family)